MKTKRPLTSIVVMVVILILPTAGNAGSLEPSAAPASTMKTLDEVEPRIPIPESNTPVPVFFITEPGSYYLVGNRYSSSHGIYVQDVNDVTIDLNGYSLIGPDTGNFYGIELDGQNNIEIRNGTIRDFGSAGIYDLTTTTTGNRVINVRVVSNGTWGGIRLKGKCTIVKDCTVIDNDSSGIIVGDDSTLTGNTVYNNNSAGINTGNGCTIKANTVYDNNNIGIQAGSGCTITDNTVAENQSKGIDVGTGCTINGCTARLNGGNGIESDGLGTIVNNTSDRNTGHGIWVNSVAVIVNNSCSENKFDGIYASTGNRIINNDCGGNGFGGDGAGIHVTSLRNVIEGNTVMLNDIGIDVDSTRNFIAKNTASMNTTDYDINSNNAYGPIINIASVGDISGTVNADHPWANFSY